MTFIAGSLAQSLDNVYRYYLDSLTDDHTARTWERDWANNTTSLAAALRRVGSAVYWRSREPSGPADDTPWVLASIDETTGLLRFDAAGAAEVAALPSADLFAWDGGPIGG